MAAAPFSFTEFLDSIFPRNAAGVRSEASILLGDVLTNFCLTSTAALIGAPDSVWTDVTNAVNAGHGAIAAVPAGHSRVGWVASLRNTIPELGDKPNRPVLGFKLTQEWNNRQSQDRKFYWTWLMYYVTDTGEVVIPGHSVIQERQNESFEMQALEGRSIPYANNAAAGARLRREGSKLFFNLSRGKEKKVHLDVHFTTIRTTRFA